MSETLRGRDWLLSPEKEAHDTELAMSLLRTSAPFLYRLGAISIDAFHLPPVYTELRVGLDGEEFWCLKSRTTLTGATYEEHRKLPPILQTARLLGFDEILQVINVVNGDMTMSGGPRPLVKEGDGTTHQSIVMMEETLPGSLFDYWYELYASVKPSLLSSYGNRGKLLPPDDLQRQCIERAHHDIDDIENAGPEKDAKIMRESMEYLARFGKMALRALN